MEKNEIFRKSNLERISSPEKMNDYIKVINPSVVLMLAALGLLLLGGLAWGFWGNIPLTENLSGSFYCKDAGGQSCDEMAAVVSVDTAAKLKMGMDVQVSPSNADRDAYGYMKGKIESVGQYPTTKEEVMGLVENEQLADYLMRSGGILVVISMEKDSNTASGILWSGEKGKDVSVKAGTTASALAIIQNQKPIELILGN